MEETNKKLNKHIIENDAEILVIFKIPDNNFKMITHIIKFNKEYSKGITIYFGKVRIVLINQIRYFCLKELSKLILYQNKIEKLSEKQLKLFNRIYERLNYICINDLYYEIKDIKDISSIERLKLTLGIV